MRRALLVVAALAGAGCPEPPSLTRDMPDEWADNLALCEPLEGDQRDWCALTAVTLTAGSGMKLYALCERLGTRDAYDRCIETAMRHPVEPPAAGMCQRIKTDEVRDTCYMDAAQQSFPYDVQTAMTACEKAGDLTDRCLVSMVSARGPMWAQTGAPVMFDELLMVVATHNGLANDRDFGTAVGMAARNVWVPSGSPCMLFLPPGSARLACETASAGTGSL